jgi:antitoxin component YwqK of YwqJK toxin-antitoxin module
MKKALALSLLLLLINGQYSWACRCPGTSFKKEDFANYDYIAYVKIKTFIPHDLPFYMWGFPSVNPTTALFTVEYLENYKGNMPKEFVMSSYDTSCDPGIRDGEEWIIFANTNQGHPFVTACSHSQRVKAKQGNTSRFCNNTNLAFMRKEFKTITPINDGLVSLFDSQNQLKALLNYVNGELHGKQRYYHPNGSLYGKEEYVNGKRNGTSAWWFQDGDKAAEVSYKNGMVDTAWVWGKKRGQSKADSLTQKSRFLKRIVIYDNGEEMNRIDYYEDGMLMRESILLVNKQVRLNHYWTYKGELDMLVVQKWDSDEKVFKEDFWIEGGVNTKRRLIQYKGKWSRYHYKPDK